MPHPKGILCQQVWNSYTSWIVREKETPHIWYGEGVSESLSATGNSSWHKQVGTVCMDFPSPCLYSDLMPGFGKALELCKQLGEETDGVDQSSLIGDRFLGEVTARNLVCNSSRSQLSSWGGLTVFPCEGGHSQFIIQGGAMCPRGFWSQAAWLGRIWPPSWRSWPALLWVVPFPQLARFTTVTKGMLLFLISKLPFLKSSSQLFK